MSCTGGLGKRLVACLRWGTLSLLLLFLCHFTFPAPDFAPPLDIDLKLSGTFGELRSNHFHAGIDLKSPDGKVGTPVYAAADGFVHRIKVKGGGYGQALYISHGNGYSTVYAHLDDFTEGLSDYVRKEQYRLKSFQVNLFPAHDMFPVKKGELIGHMGNSGHSYGPHLHFEVRRFGIPVNPLQYIPVPDETRPVFRKLYFHWFNPSKTPLRREKSPLLPTPDDTLEVAGGLMGLSVYTYDPQNGGNNKNGIYQLKMYLDEDIIFHSIYDKVPFSKTRYANAHMDYAFKKEENVKPYALYRLPGNALDLYQKMEDNGFFIPGKEAQLVRLVAEDYNGNTNELRFYLRRKEKREVQNSSPFHYLVPHHTEKSIQKGPLTVQFPKGALYHDLHFSLDENEGSFVIGNPLVPLHKYIGLEYALTDEQCSDQLFLAHCAENNKIYNAGGEIKADRLVASVRQFGKFSLEVDSVPPQIELLSWSKQNEKLKGKWKISDNFPAIGKAKDLDFEARLDDYWTLLRYDAKTGSLQWEETCTKGKHLLEIVVTDDRGNENRFEKSFSI